MIVSDLELAPVEDALLEQLQRALTIPPSGEPPARRGRADRDARRRRGPAVATTGVDQVERPRAPSRRSREAIAVWPHVPRSETSHAAAPGSRPHSIADAAGDRRSCCRSRVVPLWGSPAAAPGDIPGPGPRRSAVMRMRSARSPVVHIELRRRCNAVSVRVAVVGGGDLGSRRYGTRAPVAADPAAGPAHLAVPLPAAGPPCAVRARPAPNPAASGGAHRRREDRRWRDHARL